MQSHCNEPASTRVIRRVSLACPIPAITAISPSRFIPIHPRSSQIGVGLSGCRIRAVFACPDHPDDPITRSPDASPHPGVAFLLKAKAFCHSKDLSQACQRLHLLEIEGPMSANHDAVLNVKEQPYRCHSPSKGKYLYLPFIRLYVKRKVLAVPASLGFHSDWK